MNVATRKMLEEYDNFAVEQLDSQINEFEAMKQTVKSEDKRVWFEKEIKSLHKLRKQIIWGV